MTDNVIETRGLTRYYGKRPVVSSLDMAVPRGSVFGFLGRNGAGKSTTIRMLLGLVPPTRGSATVLGYDCTMLPASVRGRIGYLAEGHHVTDWMTVKECGRFQSQFFSWWNERIFADVLEHFDLKPETVAKDLSRGERAGLCLALTLAPEPELLILDDPALGLDVVVRRSLLESMIYVTRGADRTILFSTHLLFDVERVADRIAVLDHGVLRVCCSLDTFRESVRQYSLCFSGRPPELPPLPGLIRSLRTDHEIAVTIANPSEQTEALLRSLRPERMSKSLLGLEDAFIDYLGDRRQHKLFADDYAADEEILR